MVLTYSDVLSVLWIIVAVMLVVVLYHALFIMVDLRKVLRRIEDLTAQVEAVIMKPLTLTDQFLSWVLAYFESGTEHHKKPKKHAKKDHDFSDLPV